MKNESWRKQYQVGQTIYKAGCFTIEGYIKNLNLTEMARRLGLPQKVVSQGVYIAYAIRIPGMNEFELAGTTLDATDNFVDYSSGKPQYQPQQFQKIYTQAAVIPVNFQEIKKEYHNSFGANKLVKVLAPSAKFYPAGGMTPQFLMTGSIPCKVAAFIPPNGNFRI